MCRWTLNGLHRSGAYGRVCWVQIPSILCEVEFHYPNLESWSWRKTWFSIIHLSKFSRVGPLLVYRVVSDKIHTKELVKEFYLDYCAHGIKLINDGKSAFIVSIDRVLYIIDLESLQISEVQQPNLRERDLKY